MKKVSDYLTHVDECLAMARTARSPEQREQLLNMAATWKQLADARQRQLDQGDALAQIDAAAPAGRGDF